MVEFGSLRGRFAGPVMNDHPPKESPAQRFKRIAERRVNRAIKDLRAIANLANRSNYSYTDAQVKKIMRALRKEIGMLQSRFSEGSPSSNGEFAL